MSTRLDVYPLTLTLRPGLPPSGSYTTPLVAVGPTTTTMTTMSRPAHHNGYFGSTQYQSQSVDFIPETPPTKPFRRVGPVVHGQPAHPLSSRHPNEPNARSRADDGDDDVDSPDPVQSKGRQRIQIPVSNRRFFFCGVGWITLCRYWLLC